jgi:signal transduction histidine kinase
MFSCSRPCLQLLISPICVSPSQILDFSKIEAGQLSLLRSVQNVAEVVETAVFLVHELAVSKGLVLSWVVDPLIPSALLVDSTRLQQ